MAETYTNKVVLSNGTVLIDISTDTIEKSDVINKKTFHDKSGAPQVGTCTYDMDTSEATALASEILASKTAGVNGKMVTGTMVNNGAQVSTISTKDQEVIIKNGFHDGSGKVSIDPTEQAKIIGGNILEGVTILGVKGTIENLEYNVYDGEDLTIKYADEIAKYSDEWAWIKARIKAANFKGLRIHDYIPVKCSNNKVLRMEIAGIDTYYHNGSPEVGHHIDFISKECWDVTVQYNKVNINNGTADQAVPFMASNLKKFLMSEAGPVPNSTTDMSVTTEVDYTNDGIWHFLPDKLKNVIVEKNFFKVNRYTAGSIRTTDNTDWGWFNLSKLWLPTEKEVYGSSVYEGNGNSYGIFGRQYPCFIGHSRFKGIVGKINARCDWWLLSPYSGSSSGFCAVISYGNANSMSASFTYIRVPVCFRVA